MHFMKRVAGAGRRLGWFLSVALVAGCGGGGPQGNEYVEYDGPTLVVEGTAYKRENSMDPVFAGRVLLQLDDRWVDKGLALIERYGLTLEGRSAEGWLLVKVPDRFETQWAAALQAPFGGRSVTALDGAQSPTAIATAAPASESESEPVVPDHEPSADDVRRLVMQRYEGLEDAGGFPATVTASGKSIVIHAKVFDVRKESCRRVPQAKPGEWECEAALMMALCTGDCDPSMEEPLPKGERIGIRWDPVKGEFALPN